MAEYLIQDTTLDAIADAINAKTGGSSAMTPAEMVTEIGSISGGGEEEQGLVDMSCVYTDSGNRTWSGSVSDNKLVNISASAEITTIPMILKQPITISTNDVVKITFSNTSGRIYCDLGMQPVLAYLYQIASKILIMIAENFLFGNGSWSYTHTGDPVLISGFVLYNRTGATSGLSADVRLDINDVQIF